MHWLAAKENKQQEKFLVSFVFTNPGPRLVDTLQFLTRQLLLW